MKDVRFKIKSSAVGIYEEDAKVPDDCEDPKTFFTKEYLESWNKEFPKDQREILEVIGDTGVEYCIMDKINTMTVSRNGESYDVWQCTKCKIYYKRSSLEMPDRKCLPKLSCIPCNKLFVTEKGLELHNKRNNHKMPDWIPDGV